MTVNDSYYQCPPPSHLMMPGYATSNNAVIRGGGTGGGAHAPPPLLGLKILKSALFTLNFPWGDHGQGAPGSGAPTFRRVPPPLAVMSQN